MHSPKQKRSLGFLASATLLLWVMAQVACFFHCHYPGSQISGSQSASAERRCCSASAPDAPDAPAAGNATCMAFKNVALNGKSVSLTAPDLATFAWIVVFSAELNKTTSEDSIRIVPITAASPPLLSLLKPTLLNLPPPAIA